MWRAIEGAREAGTLVKPSMPDGFQVTPEAPHAGTISSGS